MAFARNELAKIVGGRLHGGASSRTLAKEIAAYLLEQNRVHELESLMRDVMAYRQENGVIEAEIASAHPLAPSMVEQIKKLLAEKHPDAKHIIVHEHIDASLVGGVTITLAHEKLDLSIKSKLDMFRRLAIEGIV